MNLSDEITKGLALFASDTPFDNAAFNRLSTTTFEILLRRNDESALGGNIYFIKPGRRIKALILSIAVKSDALVLKHAYSALVGFILEGIRTDAVPLQMQYVVPSLLFNLDPRTLSLSSSHSSPHHLSRSFTIVSSIITIILEGL